MADDYWFAWYPGHYERDAGHLDHVADSCYRRLIDAYMRGGEPIPKNPIRLMFITRTTPQQFQAVWPQIEEFFTEVNGNLHLKRCDTELDRQDMRRKFASEAGKRSGEKRRKGALLAIMGPVDKGTTVERPLNDRSRTTVERPLNDRCNILQCETGDNKDLGTTVERPLNDPRNEGTGGDKIESITTTLPDTPREAPPAPPLNGHGHKSGNGVNLDLNPLSAKRAFRNGEPSKADKHALFEQRTLRFALHHYSQDQYAQMITLQLSDAPDDARKRKDVFNAADADYQSRKAAGTLRPMGEA